jgi:hypothetical protein
MSVFGRPWLIGVQPTKVCVEKRQYWAWGVWFVFTGFAWIVIFRPNSYSAIFARDAHRNARRYSCKIAVKTARFKWKLIGSQLFRKIIQYDIFWKFVDWFLNMCTCVRIDGETAITQTRHIGVGAPKNERIRINERKITYLFRVLWFRAPSDIQINIQPDAPINLKIYCFVA